jgi:Photoprotection regulator fluorescence recovery protein
MQAIDIEWSQTEQEVAKEAFDKAYEREIKALMALVQEKAGAIAKLDDMWSLHDFLSAKRHDIDGKYDYRYQ